MRKLMGPVAVCLFVFGASVLTEPALANVHFELVKSSPADESTLDAAPTSIDLWFSQAPDMAGTRIRLIDHHDEVVELGQVTQDADDPLLIHASIEGDASHGGYTIHWRGMAKDGHIVSGELAFEVESSH